VKVARELQVTTSQFGASKLTLTHLRLYSESSQTGQRGKKDAPSKKELSTKHKTTKSTVAAANCEGSI
jgi:hypothetical protein